jgi:hypothetical protein
MGCGGDDCDDTDSRVFPGQTLYFDTPTKGNAGWDFNCNNGVEQKYAALNCAGLALVMCDTTTQGFLAKTAPACGVRGMFGRCAKSGLQCLDQVEVADFAMPCR